MKRLEALEKEIAELKLVCEEKELLIKGILREMPHEVELYQEFIKIEEGKRASYAGLDAIIECMNRKRTAEARAAPWTMEPNRLNNYWNTIQK